MVVEDNVVMPRVLIDQERLGESLHYMHVKHGMLGDRPRASTGRPSVFEMGMFTRICDRIASGMSLRSAVIGENVAACTFLEWIRDDRPAGVSKRYEDARRMQRDFWADELIDIADDGTNDFIERETKQGKTIVLDREHISRSALRVETRKWLLAKLVPAFRDKASLEHSGPEGGPIKIDTVDPIEAARAYQVLMRGEG